MAPYIPITLEGYNLGQRHNYLNSLVNNAYKEGIPFENIQDVPELTPVDRLFKIDLASKYKNVDYILKTLKDEDLLYVSRALKSSWLLDPQYSGIINPGFLEDSLYPDMLTTAANKMKHWVHLKLKDTKRNEEFYEYYKHKKNSNAAGKHLLNCSAEYIFNEVNTDMLCQFSLKYLKIICEKCPNILKTYFDGLQQKMTILPHYLDNEKNTYDILKKSLKSNTEVFLDYIEQFFNNKKCQRLSSDATRYIIKFNKNRFVSKPELYTAWLLDIKTLSQLLDTEETKDIILRLAKADYLGSWFSYKNIEPFLKTMSGEDRTKFKRLLFVDKSFGDKVTTWPYQTPCSPEREKREEDDVFSDIEPSVLKPYSASFCHSLGARGAFRCKKAATKTLLDKLFDQYRVASFKHTFYELRKKIVAESSAQNREYMMLVLVSKSGGQIDQVRDLLEWLVARHINEPATVRAAVVRSLVKRAAVWRLPDHAWELLMQFSNGLGLDGQPASAFCREGLHCVVIRDLLLNLPSKPNVFNAFLEIFTPFSEYSVNSVERRIIRERLPGLLLSAATEQPSNTSERLSLLLDTLSAYRLRLADCPGSIKAFITFAHSDPSVAYPLLQRIFNSRDARKELFEVNFKLLTPTDQSYSNALLHNVELLLAPESKENLLKIQNMRHERFFRKLAVYFAEKEGLASIYLNVLQARLLDDPQIKYSRPIALLSSGHLNALLTEFDTEPKKSDRRRFAAALRANGHVARPPLDINALGWKSAGAKAVANRVTVCTPKNSPQLIPLLLEWRRTLRLALMLTERVPGTEASTFATVAAVRPIVAIRGAFKNFKRRGEKSDPQVWSTVKPLIQGLDLNRCIRPTTNSPRPMKYLKNVIQPRSQLGQNVAIGFPVRYEVSSFKDQTSVYKTLHDISSIPAVFRSEYLAVVYTLFTKFSKDSEALCILKYMSDIIDEMDNEFITNLLKAYINSDLEEKKLKEPKYVEINTRYTKTKILCRYLMLCKDGESQKNKLKEIGQPFFDKVEGLWNTSSKDSWMVKDILENLKYRKVWFDSVYEDLLPLFDKIKTWFQIFLPFEKYFNWYVTLNLTKSFYKSVKYAMTQNPDIFNDSKKANVRVDLIGNIFGKYVAHDLEELTVSYFPSIRVPYQDDLIEYLRTYLNWSDSRRRFIRALLEGIIKEGHNNINAQIMAAFVLVEEADSDRNNFSNDLKKINKPEIMFLVGYRIPNYY